MIPGSEIHTTLQILCQPAELLHALVFDFSAGERQKDLETSMACCPFRYRGSSGPVARKTGDWVFPLW